MITNVDKIIHLIPDAVFRNFEGEVVEWLDQRPQPTQSELNDITDQEVIDKRNELPNKKAADIAALGTRAAMQAEAANANSIPALRDLVLKLAEIIYSNEKGTID